ncbi:FliO/MopB family protein, partial [Tersicoccus solisilvae]|uniref:FliO/MopB family protein n=1 Tax=Tersicoccus solisilvae TaxID=1882339 RepID=UPI00166911D4
MDSLVLGLRVLVSLAAVLGLIWVLQRRLKRRGGSTRAAGPVISVLGRQGVGHKASVVLLDADGQRLLLGVTEHRVSVLRSTPDTEAAPASTEAAFASTLSAATGSPRRAAAHRPRATRSAAPAPDLPAGTAAVTTSISEPDHGSVLLAATVPAEDPEG